MQNRSITQKLSRTKSKKVKLEIILKWLKAWENEQLKLIKNLEQGIIKDDYDKLCINTGQIKKVTEKKFSVIYKIFIKLTENLKNE